MFISVFKTGKETATSSGVSIDTINCSFRNTSTSAQHLVRFFFELDIMMYCPQQHIRYQVWVCSVWLGCVLCVVRVSSYNFMYILTTLYICMYMYMYRCVHLLATCRCVHLLATCRCVHLLATCRCVHLLATCRCVHLLATCRCAHLLATVCLSFA